MSGLIDALVNLINNTGILVLRAVATATLAECRRSSLSIRSDGSRYAGGHTGHEAPWWRIYRQYPVDGRRGRIRRRFSPPRPSKWAARAMTKAAAALDLAGYGILVNAILPGEVNTPVIADLGFGTDPTPLGLFGASPSEFGKPVR